MKCIKRVFLISIFFCMSLVSIAQEENKELFIVYNFTINGTVERMELTSNWQASLCKTVPIMQSWGQMSFGPKSSDVYKDYTKNYLTCEDFNGQIFLQETLNQFDWKITNPKDSILGYHCRQAKCTFRGRDYVAYFTTEIPFKAAPWKFHGLPGVVLKVYSVDDYLTVEAKVLKIRTKTSLLKDPYRGKKYMSWKKFTKVYIKNTKERLETNAARHLRYGIKTGGLSALRPEIILEYNRRMLTDEELTKEFEKYKYLDE